MKHQGNRVHFQSEEKTVPKESETGTFAEAKQSEKNNNNKKQKFRWNERRKKNNSSEQLRCEKAMMGSAAHGSRLTAQVCNNLNVTDYTCGANERKHLYKYKTQDGHINSQPRRVDMQDNKNRFIQFYYAWYMTAACWELAEGAIGGCVLRAHTSMTTNGNAKPIYISSD